VYWPAYLLLDFTNPVAEQQLWRHTGFDRTGFVLVADAAAEVDDGDAEELLDSALRGVIRDMISTRTHGDPQPSRTLPTVAPPQSPPPLHYQVATPQPTPTGERTFCYEQPLFRRFLSRFVNFVNAASSARGDEGKLRPAGHFLRPSYTQCALLVYFGEV